MKQKILTCNLEVISFTQSQRNGLAVSILVKNLTKLMIAAIGNSSYWLVYT